VKIICTGISCSGRKELMHDFQALCEKKGLKIGFFNVGDFMKRAAAEAGIEFTEKVLDSDTAVLALARKSAFYEIAANLAQNHEHAFIGIHACFRWRGVLLEGLPFRDILTLHADVFINVVDNLADIEKRMSENPQWSGMPRDEINVWIDEEEFLTKQFASFSNKPYYIVTKNHNLENFYDLLFSQKKKLYLSYPITLLRETPEKIEQIRAVGARLAKFFIVFDPLDIKDMEFLASLEKSDSGAKVGDIDKGMIERIKTRTISRDYQFIRQSDFIVVMYPTDKLSPGVLSEMNFASRYNKPVYAVYTHARSIFFENLCEQIFDSPEEMERFLVETYATEPIPNM